MIDRSKVRRILSKIILTKDEQITYLITGSTECVATRLNWLERLIYLPIHSNEIQPLITISKEEFSNYLKRGGIQHFKKAKKAPTLDGLYYIETAEGYETFLCERGLIEEDRKLLNSDQLNEYFLELLWPIDDF